MRSKRSPGLMKLMAALGFHGAVVSLAFTTGSQAAVLWQLSPGDRPYLTTNDAQRGLTYNPVNDHLLVVNRLGNSAADIHVLDANTGVDLHQLDTTAVSSAPGFFKLNMIGAADDGVIYSANVTIEASTVHTNTVIHRWANDSPNTPSTMAYGGFDDLYSQAGRLGDTLDVRGAGADTQILMGSQQRSVVVVFTTSDGLTFTPTVMPVTGVPVNFSHRGIAFGPGNTVWAKNAFGHFFLIEFDLESQSTRRLQTHFVSANSPEFFLTGISVDPVWQRLAGITARSLPFELRAYDIADVTDPPVLRTSAPFSTANTNLFQVGSTDFGGARIYGLNAGNGIVAVATEAPPVIQAHPQSQVVMVGGNVTFAVRATGSPALNYQWLFNSLPIPGATGSSFTITNAQLRDGGGYSVIVSNILGVEVSNEAQLRVNRRPMAFPQVVTVNEDTSATIELTATDLDGDVLIYSVTPEPTNGTFLENGSRIIYHPSTNYFGPDEFRFVVYDGFSFSAEAAVTISVLPVNDPPLVYDSAFTLNEDMPLTLTLEGSDVERDALTFRINPPRHGTISGAPPQIVYRPDANYFGPDEFTFHAADGQSESLPGRISLSVLPVNDPPLADSMVLSLDEDAFVGVTLSATDVDGDPLNYEIVRGPSHGDLRGRVPSIVYQPVGNYHGPDEFTFRVYDGQSASAEALVRITVNSVNDPPQANDIVVQVDEDGSVSIVLRAQDPDGDILSYTAGSPMRGTLSGAAPDFVYRPESNYHGTDEFIFTVVDAQNASSSGVVRITVVSVNDPPIAQPQAAALDEDGTLQVTLTASDVDSDLLNYRIVTPPSRGTLHGSAPNLLYQPFANFAGVDAFTFQASDGQVHSAEAVVNLTIRPVNDAPIVRDTAVTVDEDNSVVITLGAVDPDGDPLTYLFLPPTNGTLAGAAPTFIYHPNPDFAGFDHVIFTASDGTLHSTQAVVTIAVASVNDVPVPQIQVSPAIAFPRFSIPVLISTNGVDALVTLDGSSSTDAENDVLSFNWFDGIDPISFDMVASTRLGVGPHTVSLLVSDGSDQATASTSFEIVAASDGVGAIIELVELSSPGRKSIRPLIATLKASAASLESGNLPAGTHQLHAFQNKVRAQVATLDPALARALVSASQLIIDALAGNH